MRCYLHYDVDGAPEFTKVFKLEPSDACTVADAVLSFVHAYNSRHAPPLDAQRMVLLSARRRPLALRSLLTRVLQDREDAYLMPSTVPRSHPHAATRPPAPPPHAAAGTDAAPLTAGPSSSLVDLPEASRPTSGPPQANPAASAAHQSVPAGNAPLPAALPAAPEAELRVRPVDVGARASVSLGHDAVPIELLRAALDKAGQAVGARDLRVAAELYQSVLRLVPGHPEALEGLTRLWIQAGKGERAVQAASRLAATSATPGSGTLQLLGEAYS